MPFFHGRRNQGMRRAECSLVRSRPHPSHTLSMSPFPLPRLLRSRCLSRCLLLCHPSDFRSPSLTQMHGTPCRASNIMLRSSCAPIIPLSSPLLSNTTRAGGGGIRSVSAYTRRGRMRAVWMVTMKMKGMKRTRIAVRLRVSTVKVAGSVSRRAVGPAQVVQ